MILNILKRPGVGAPDKFTAILRLLVLGFLNTPEGRTYILRLATGLGITSSISNYIRLDALFATLHELMTRGSPILAILYLQSTEVVDSSPPPELSQLLQNLSQVLASLAGLPPEEPYPHFLDLAHAVIINLLTGEGGIKQKGSVEIPVSEECCKYWHTVLQLPHLLARGGELQYELAKVLKTYNTNKTYAARETYRRHWRD